MFLRASIYWRVVSRSRARGFDSVVPQSQPLQAHISSTQHRLFSSPGTHRLFSSPGTMAAEAPTMNCMRKQREGPEAVDSGDKSMNNLQKLQRIQEIMAKSSGNQWDDCWKEGLTPWDVGGVTPIIQHLVEQGQLPQGRALVPGCGSGYDVLALASESRQVVGLDISESASTKAKTNAAQDPRGKWVQFVADDFFKYTPEGPFDLIFDYTFFCALDPELRPRWASKMAELLSPDGELLTLIFPIDTFAGGPPYAVSVELYEKVLNPLGLTLVYCEDNEFSLPARKGKEKVGRWKKTSSKI